MPLPVFLQSAILYPIAGTKDPEQIERLGFKRFSSQLFVCVRWWDCGFRIEQFWEPIASQCLCSFVLRQGFSPAWWSRV